METRTHNPNQDDNFSDWWNNNEIEIFYFDNNKLTISLTGREPRSGKLLLKTETRLLQRIKNKNTMMKIDPIIAVKDVEASSKWYQQVFGFRRKHGGKERFAVLVSENDEILLCLHKWEEHHPTMTNPGITPGNGLILYFRTENMDAIRQNIEKIGSIVEEEIHLNPNSLRKEFSLRDPDGYYLTITEFHKYEG